MEASQTAQLTPPIIPLPTEAVPNCYVDLGTLEEGSPLHFVLKHAITHSYYPCITQAESPWRNEFLPGVQASFRTGFRA